VFATTLQNIRKYVIKVRILIKSKRAAWGQKIQKSQKNQK